MVNFKFRNNLKIIVVIGLLIFLHWIKILLPAERLLFRIGQPLSQKIYGFSAHWRGDYDARTQNVNWEEQAKKLEEKVTALTVANANLQDLQEENNKLRQYLNFFNQTKVDYVLANIISQDNFLDAGKFGQDVVINKGSADNLTPGLVATNEQGVVVGKVMAVKNDSAKVCLLTNAACKLAVTILNQNRTIGVTAGDLGLTVKLNFVGQTDKINVGDIVATSGLEKDIPAGLVVGRISQINNNQNDVWQNISVEPAVNFDNLRIVAIARP
jgi:rod shape-determining protein MreC